MRKFLVSICAVSVFGVSLAASDLAKARENIQIVGSSTVYPFVTVVSEKFGRSTDFKTPIVEATGSGGGMKLFCGGVGEAHPDITNASRRIKASEFEQCQQNGVQGVIEVKLGYDGIVLASSKAADQQEFTLEEIFLALAKQVPNPDGTPELIDNPYQMWSDINGDLPATRIEVLGPPPTSGTRDAFVELAMEGGCSEFDWIKALKQSDKNQYKSICHTIREDGAFVEAGENDNLIVQKLEKNPNAFGVFGFSFLDQNSDRVQGALIDGVEPEFELISDGSYPVSRSLYMYIKDAHIGVIAGMEEFLEELTDEDTWGEEGYLADRGLIPMPEEEQEIYQNNARSRVHLAL